jgi:hypothetical protein
LWFNSAQLLVALQRQELSFMRFSATPIAVFIWSSFARGKIVLLLSAFVAAGALATAFPQTTCRDLLPDGDPANKRLAAACQRVWELQQRLPNFLCEESVSTFKQSWLQHKITAQVAYEDGREQYRDIEVDGKSVASMSVAPGSWSTGEFGSDLLVLFNPAGATKFVFKKLESVESRSVYVFEFALSRQNNHSWEINVPGAAVTPGFSGRLYVDAETANVVRVEFRAVDFDGSSGLESYVKVIEYAEVKLGDGSSFLLPQKSRQEICTRQSGCFRNELKFTNFRKFAARSRVLPAY